MRFQRIYTDPVVEDVYVLPAATWVGTSAVEDNPMDAPALDELEPEVQVPEIDVEALQQEAYQKGLQEGRQHGLQNGLAQGIEQGAQQTQQQVDTLLAALQQAISELAATRDQLCKGLEAEAVELAYNVARKVVQDESIAPKVVLTGIVKSAIEAAREVECLSLRLNPEDVQSAGREDIEALLGPAGCSFVEDESVPRGACVMDTNFGKIEVDLEARWQAIAACLRDETLQAG